MAAPVDASANSPETTAPREMGQTSAPAPDAANEHYDPSQDDAAALEAFRAARKAVETADTAPSAPAAQPAPEVKPEASAQASIPASSSPKDEDLSPEDAKLARILNRISRAEDAANAAHAQLRERDAELERLRARAARADEYDRDFAEFNQDPEKLFKRVGWKPETIQDYILNGPKASSPQLSAFEQQQAQLKKELEELKAERARHEHAARVDAFKNALPAQIASEREKLPFLHNFYENPRELADALYGLMDHTYQSQKKELTALEAAQQIEKTLSSHFERLDRARSKVTPNSSNPAPAAKPSLPTLTNSPPTSAIPTPPPPDQEDDETLMQRAIATLRAGRKPS